MSLSRQEGMVHLYLKGGREIQWSGYNATGDPGLGPYWIKIDVDSFHYITSDGDMIVSRVSMTEPFSPNALATAAIHGMFGFRVVEGPNDGPLSKPPPVRRKKGAGQQDYPTDLQAKGSQ